MPKKLTQQEFEIRVAEYTKDKVEVISKYINKKTRVKIKCKKCGYIWEISPASLCPSETKSNNFSGCPQCLYTIIKCDYCGKEFTRLKSDVKTSKSGYHYCSKECGNRHKNSFVKSDNSFAYRRNAFDNYEHKCAVCGWAEDIRLLEVHHIDENRENNELDNLIILCPICHKKLTLHLCDLIDRKYLI